MRWISKAHFHPLITKRPNEVRKKQSFFIWWLSVSETCWWVSCCRGTPEALRSRNGASPDGPDPGRAPVPLASRTSNASQLAGLRSVQTLKNGATELNWFQLSDTCSSSCSLKCAFDSLVTQHLTSRITIKDWKTTFLTCDPLNWSIRFHISTSCWIKECFSPLNRYFLVLSAPRRQTVRVLHKNSKD